MNILLTYCTIFSALVIISSSYADFVYVTNSPDEEPGYTAVYKVDVVNGNGTFPTHFFIINSIFILHMYKCSSTLYIVFHILLYILTQDIMHTYVTLQPQGTLNSLSMTREQLVWTERERIIIICVFGFIFNVVSNKG